MSLTMPCNIHVIIPNHLFILVYLNIQPKLMLSLMNLIFINQLFFFLWLKLIIYSLTQEVMTVMFFCWN